MLTHQFFGEIGLIQNPSHCNTNILHTHISLQTHVSITYMNDKEISISTNAYGMCTMDCLPTDTLRQADIKHRSQSVFPSWSFPYTHTHQHKPGIRCTGCGLSICGCVCRLPGWGNKRTRWLILTATTCYARNHFLALICPSNYGCPRLFSLCFPSYHVFFHDYSSCGCCCCHFVPPGETTSLCAFTNKEVRF